MRRCSNSSWRPSGAASRAVSWVGWKAAIDRSAGMLCGRITGLAGLLAGACSMALGEWVSVTSARELAQREIRIESSELAEDPEAEGEELKLIYEAKGLSPSEAETMVRSGDHDLHGGTGVAVRRPSAPAGPCGGRIDIRRRQSDRHGDQMTALHARGAVVMDAPSPT